MDEYYIILLQNTCRIHVENILDIVEIKNFEILNLIITYITVHYSAIFLVCFQKMCFYISRKAMKAVCDYFI